MSKPNAVISIVDDDESVRNSLKRLMKSMGFEAESYPSAQEFLQRGPLHSYGCAIVDVRMPGMNGPDLQKVLSDSGILLPVIFITAYDDPHARVQAMNAGAVAFFQKPLNDLSLKDAIDTALKRSGRQTSDRPGR
jgi:FixJ family two-component response regulator